MTDGTCPDCGGPLDLDTVDCARHGMWQRRAEGGPERGGDAKLTASGRPERRRFERRGRARRAEDDGRKPVTRAEMRHRVGRLKREMRALFLLLGLISSGAGYLGYQAGQDSNAGLARNSAQSSFDTCISGAELRVAIANGLDDLRTLAITPRVPKRIRERFISQTQPAIDALLTQAAYGTEQEARGRRYTVSLESTPPGAVSTTVALDVRRLAFVRCTDRAGRTFPGTATTTG